VFVSVCVGIGVRQHDTVLFGSGRRQKGGLEVGYLEAGMVGDWITVLSTPKLSTAAPITSYLDF
jgi:hypothetical protein